MEKFILYINILCSLETPAGEFEPKRRSRPSQQQGTVVLWGICLNWDRAGENHRNQPERIARYAANLFRLRSANKSDDGRHHGDGPSLQGLLVSAA
jgi:hypothetical protein